MARVLVIEDNPVNLELMVFLLQAHGHEVHAATDGDEGVARARELEPDLIVCDVEMPGRDGYAVAAELKSEARLAAIPLVAVTAHAMVGDRDSALSVGFDAHFAKPIDPPAFVKAVDSMLGAGHRTHAARETPDASMPVGDVPPEHRAPRPGLRLLVVDDTPANLDYKCQLLEPAGYRTLTATSVAEAHQLLGATRVDMVLCDVVMPGGTGIDLLAALRRDDRNRHVPFILLTASTYNNVLRKQGMALGAQRFLTHPIGAHELLQEIRAVLESGAPGAGSAAV